LRRDLGIRYGVGRDEPIAVVSVPDQRLHLIDGPSAVRSYAVSTSRHGTGCAEGSHRTPTGVHRVCLKIGEGAAPGTVFRGREPVGRVADRRPASDEDLITTRILWLDGQEPGLNRGGDVDSRRRYIYIHGTPHADRIGRPASMGCIRMTDADVVELFDALPEQAWVVILG
jgi:lipoprotein-anchoring transpeptidase ErfK/SrfK